MTQRKLILCEKPSVAQTISAVLGANKRLDGYFEGRDLLISWCYGHLVEHSPAEAYGEQYAKWAYETLPLLPKVWKFRAASGKTFEMVAAAVESKRLGLAITR